MSWTKQTGTKHVDGCRRRFRYYDMTCLRCQELADGAEPRTWNVRPQYAYSFKSCNHNNLNPGGYCNTCGNGRDFS